MNSKLQNTKGIGIGSILTDVASGLSAFSEAQFDASVLDVLTNIANWFSGNDTPFDAIAKLGEQALEHIKLNYTPSTEWTNEAFKILKEASKSFGDTELAVVAEIESLLKQQMTPIPKSFPIF